MRRRFLFEMVSEINEGTGGFFFSLWCLAVGWDARKKGGGEGCELGSDGWVLGEEMLER